MVTLILTWMNYLFFIPFLQTTSFYGACAGGNLEIVKLALQPETDINKGVCTRCFGFGISGYLLEENSIPIGLFLF
jgi:hypothetical protein